MAFDTTIEIWKDGALLATETVETESEYEEVNFYPKYNNWEHDEVVLRLFYKLAAPYDYEMRLTDSGKWENRFKMCNIWGEWQEVYYGGKEALNIADHKSCPGGFFDVMGYYGEESGFDIVVYSEPFSDEEE